MYSPPHSGCFANDVISSPAEGEWPCVNLDESMGVSPCVKGLTVLTAVQGPFDPQQENLTPAGGTAQRDPKPPRSLSAALQPLSIETAGARGVDIGTGYASDDEPGPVAARVPPAVTLAQV